MSGTRASTVQGTYAQVFFHCSGSRFGVNKKDPGSPMSILNANPCNENQREVPSFRLKVFFLMKPFIMFMEKTKTDFNITVCT
jgi:hypothetical protein